MFGQTQFFLSLALLSACLVSSQSVAQDEQSDPNEQIERGLTAARMNELVDQLSAADRIVTDLTMRFDGSKMLFDATSSVNKDKKPWVVQLNLKDGPYKAAVKKYKGDFDAVVHRSLTAGGTRYHAVVWVQSADKGVELKVPDGPLPETGATGADLEPLNDLMRRMVQENKLPGATMAVAFEQEILFERGFGYSELDPATPMPANATMRIASLSKPITAVGVLLLVQDGVLNLDEPALNYLAKHLKGKFDPEAAAAVDARWSKVTVRHLLQHSGGTDRDASKDTVFQLPEVSKTLELRKLAKSNDMVRYQLGRPLDFEPGSKYVYSNIGYAMLGRIIEAVSGKEYGHFIQERILTPNGMMQTRLAKTRLKDRASDEVRYYTQQEKKCPAVWAGLDGRGRGRDEVEMVLEPYGMWDIEVMDSHGGWTSTAADLLRFIIALEHPEQPLLNAATRREMLNPPGFDPGRSRGLWYGCGWNVRNLTDDGAATYWHNGLLAGTSTIMVHRRDGYSWAVLFNCDKTKDDKQCASVIDSQVHQAVAELAH
jgi:CubicO group peptidase (beta-lactamase class C family)